MTDPTEKVYKEVDRHDPIITEGIEKAPTYKKKGEVRAQLATGGETIKTILANGTKETTNTAKVGDYIITNPGGERYIVKPEKFNKRYGPKEGEDGVYEAKGYCKAITNPYGEDVEIMASWGETETGNSECMFADTYDPETNTLGGEPYIIEKAAFEQTYAKVETE